MNEILIDFLLKQTESLLGILLKKTWDWLTEELNLPENIKSGIKKLRIELEMMRAFIKDMDAQKKKANLIEMQIQHVRDVARKIELVIDMVAYENDRKNAQENVSWRSRSKENHSIAALMEDIEAQLNNIQELRSKYPVQHFSSHPPSISSYDHEGSIAPLYTPEEDIVGVEEPKSELLSWALDVEEAYKAMFVVGIGGSGKTALVKSIYEWLKSDFECHVWLAASKFERGQDLLSTMVSKLFQSPPSSSHTITDLIDVLNEYLRNKRCLVVVDDLRSRNIWNSFRFVVPRYNCSRVIITTRRGDIASSCRGKLVDVYRVQPLPLDKARQLFHRIASPEIGMYPSSEKLLRECEGLPLGIIEIGKLLSNRSFSESECNRLYNSLQAELTSGQLSSITQVLLLSYYELPEHLKDCFLYMSMFPMDYPVKCRNLIRLWIADGFIDGVKGKTLEDIGEEYLKELMERDLIQAGDLDFDGRPRTCRVRKLVHKIALSKAEAESFCAVRGDISEKTRRLSIQNNEFNVPDAILPHVKTLLALRSPPGDFISKMKLLKTLHLDNACLDALPSAIDKLYLLKYLSLCNTQISIIPEEIGRLQHLETLNLKQTLVTSLPNTLTKLQKLRHLLVRRYIIGCYLTFHAVQGCCVPVEIWKLTNLQRLSFVKADWDPALIHALRYLRELRKLGVIDLPANCGILLCQTIEMLQNLHSLSVRSRHRNEVLNIQEINNPPIFLQRLYLWGHLDKMPHWISKLQDLQRIRLKWTTLTHYNNPITILGQLRNLLELQLLDAYTGILLEFDSGAFPKLRILEFEQMENLAMIIIDNGALPSLQRLIIRKCLKLTQIPVGIDRITQLKELVLNDMPPDFVDPLRSVGRLRHLVRHIETIYSRRLQSDGQWAEEFL